MTIKVKIQKGKSDETSAREGYKLTKLGWIPEKWEIYKFKQIAFIDKESISNGISSDYIFTYLSLSDVEKGKIINILPKIKFHDAPSRARRKVKNGDILLSTVRPNLLGYYYFKLPVKDFIVSTGFSVLTPKDNVSGEYIYQYLYSKALQNQFHRLVVGSNYPAINSSDVKNLIIPLPPLPEQQKIAQILSTWDKVIEKTEQLIQAKNQLKKGLMQQLLTGKKRFKEFEGSEWKELVFSELGKTYTGLSGKNKDDFGEGAPYIPYLNIFSNSRIDINQLDYVKINENEKQNEVKYGDIFFTTSSETSDEVGMTSVLLNEVENIYLNSFCFGFRLKDFTILKPEFARFSFRSITIRKEIFRLSQGSTRYNLSKNQLVKIKLKLPSIREQLKIATFLSCLEDEICILRERLGKYNEQKKGLMQKLLNGEVRVKI